MRIIYFHQYFTTPSMPGSMRSYEMARRLVLSGHTVFMVTTNRDHFQIHKPTYTLESGIHVFWLPVKYSNNMLFFRRLLAFISFSWFAIKQGNKLKADLIIATSTPLTIVIPAIFHMKLKKISMIFEVRDLWPKVPIAMGELKNKLLIYLAKNLETYAYKNSSKIIALSVGMKKNIIKTGISKEKIITIPNLGSTIHNKLSKINKYKFKWLKERPLVLYAGTLGRVNGIKYLVEIASEVYQINNQIRFLIAGGGKEKEKVQQYAGKIGVLNKNLFIIKPLINKDLPCLLSLATIVSSFTIPIPALKHNSANKFFDGLAAGKPIMINYGGWQKDLLEKEQAGFFIPQDNAKQAAIILNNFIKDKKRLEEYGKSANRVAMEYFSVDKLYRKFENTIMEVSRKSLC